MDEHEVAAFGALAPSRTVAPEPEQARLACLAVDLCGPARGKSQVNVSMNVTISLFFPAVTHKGKKAQRQRQSSLNLFTAGNRHLESVNQARPLEEPNTSYARLQCPTRATCSTFTGGRVCEENLTYARASTHGFISTLDLQQKTIGNNPGGVRSGMFVFSIKQTLVVLGEGYAS